MKKIVLNISDSTFEKLRLEAIQEKKDIQTLLAERIFYKPFNKDVEETFDNWMERETSKLIEE